MGIERALEAADDGLRVGEGLQLVGVDLVAESGRDVPLDGGHVGDVGVEDFGAVHGETGQLRSAKR